MTFIINSVNYLLNMVFYYILPVNQWSQTDLFVWSGSHNVSRHRWPWAERYSNTCFNAAETLRRWHWQMRSKTGAAPISHRNNRLKMILTFMCAAVPPFKNNRQRLTHTLLFISQIRQGHYVGQCERIVLRGMWAISMHWTCERGCIKRDNAALSFIAGLKLICDRLKGFYLFFYVHLN